MLKMHSQVHKIKGVTHALKHFYRLNVTNRYKAVAGQVLLFTSSYV